MKKTNEELVQDIRHAGFMIDHNWTSAISLSGEVGLPGLAMIESNANALAIYCKLLRQRLEAQDPSIQHLRATLAEGE